MPTEEGERQTHHNLLLDPLQRLLESLQPLFLAAQACSQGKKLFIVLVDELDKLLSEVSEILSQLCPEFFEWDVYAREQESVGVECGCCEEGVLVGKRLEGGEVQ